MRGSTTTGSGGLRPAGRARALERGGGIAAAVVEAIAYSDLFDWPLTAREVHRFLPLPARPDDVLAALAASRACGAVASVDGLYVLPGRGALADERRRREARSALLWPRARRACRAVATLPWVRLVAVSGSLAVGAAEDEADVDLFIVALDGRVWLTRALTIALGKVAARAERRRAPWLCPNYILAATSLALPERDLFTARELAQLVPIHGPDAYRELLAANSWYRDVLPNHPGHEGTVAELPGRRARRAVEPLLANPMVSRLERWEMDRKVARLRPRSDSTEVRFDATACKGHFGEHRGQTLRSLDIALAQLEARAP